MPDQSRRLSEEEAQHVWQRALELHSAAVHRQTEQPSALTVTGGPEGYDLRQVRDAAVEVGIAPEHVAVAMAEQLDAIERTGDGVDKWAERLTGGDPRLLVMTRRFDRAAKEVYPAIQSVLAGHHLTMIDSPGDPLGGGVLIYAFRETGAGTTDRLARDLMSVRIEELRVRLLPIGEASCVVSLSAPLSASRRAHLGIGAALIAGGGLFGGWAAGAVTAFALLPLSIGSGGILGLIGASMLVGALGGGSLGVAGSRAAYRSRQRPGTAALERLLQEIGMKLREAHER